MTNLILCHGMVNRAPNQIVECRLLQKKREWTELECHSLSNRLGSFSTSMPILAKAFRIRVFNDYFNILLYLGLVFEPHNRQSSGDNAMSRLYAFQVTHCIRLLPPPPWHRIRLAIRPDPFSVSENKNGGLRVSYVRLP